MAYEILLTSMNDKSGKMKDIGTNDSTFSVNIYELKMDFTNSLNIFL